MPERNLRTFLDRATTTYYEALRNHPRAVEYLRDERGLSGDNVRFFRLGVVADPLPGHERYQGRIAIPYLTATGTVLMRFRALDDGGPKYLTETGADDARLFNPADLSRPEPFIAVCEGEIDAITAHQAGIPAVGVSGVSKWRPFFNRVFAGYAQKFVLADGDDAGQGVEFADKVAAKIGGRVIPMPSGHDVNSYVKAEGPDALREMLEVA